MPEKRYDREYFDRWYRHPKRASLKRGILRRKVALPLAIAEHLLGREVRTVLDVGCGEAPWRAELKRLRPRISYVGVDSSAYVVQRFGRTRDIVSGTVGALAELGLEGPFDLVVCTDVLHYVGNAELERGVNAIAALIGGVAYLEVFTSRDEFAGDRRQWRRRSARTYRQVFEAAGLLRVGMNCWVSQDLQPSVSDLEGWR